MHWTSCVQTREVLDDWVDKLRILTNLDYVSFEVAFIRFS